jgi:hypothetical protein
MRTSTLGIYRWRSFRALTPLRQLARYFRMTVISPNLTASEYCSLQELAKGFYGNAISTGDAQRLLGLKLIYRLLGDLRITTLGRARIAKGSSRERLI